MEKRKNQFEDFKIDLLNQLDFTWNRQGVVKGSFPKDDQWMMWYNQLKKFKKENGRCNVSQSDSENKRLGKWLNDQRTLYKGRTNANGSKIFLREDRRKLLEEIGVVWDAQAIKNDELFEIRFTELLEFKKIYGHLKKPKKCKEFPKLGTWLSQIKYRGTTPERLARLNEIGIA